MRCVIACDKIDTAVSKGSTQRRGVRAAANRRIDTCDPTNRRVHVTVEEQVMRGHLAGEVETGVTQPLDGREPRRTRQMQDVSASARLSEQPPRMLDRNYLGAVGTRLEMSERIRAP